MQGYFWVVCVALVASRSAFGSPLNQEETGSSNEITEKSEEDIGTTTTKEVEAEKTVKDLYVIRKVVYEIGILTDADNTTEYDNKTHEQIDVSFYDPSDNGSFIDLSNIPFPVETNVSGVALTGILPSNFGNLVFPQNGTVASLNASSLPLFPDKQVKVTKNISTVDKAKSANILSGISDVLGLSKLASFQDPPSPSDEKVVSK